MAKSRLCTEEIQLLRDQGMSTAEIAQRSGITTHAVRYRLNRERYRQPSYKWLVENNETAKNKNVERQARKQQLSLETATVRGEWSAREIAFLESNAQTMTMLQVAQHLQRTFHSVRRSAVRYGVTFRVA